VNGFPERTVADFPSSFPDISEDDNSPYEIDPFSSTKRINLSTLIVDVRGVLLMIKLRSSCGRKRDEPRSNVVGFDVIRDLERGVASIGYSGTVAGSGRRDKQHPGMGFSR
jgi:hypothetical protein